MGASSLRREEHSWCGGQLRPGARLGRRR